MADFQHNTKVLIMFSNQTDSVFTIETMYFIVEPLVELNTASYTKYEFKGMDLSQATNVWIRSQLDTYNKEKNTMMHPIFINPLRQFTDNVIRSDTFRLLRKHNSESLSVSMLTGIWPLATHLYSCLWRCHWLALYASLTNEKRDTKRTDTDLNLSYDQ